MNQEIYNKPIYLQINYFMAQVFIFNFLLI